MGADRVNGDVTCCSIYLAIACSFLMGTGDSFLATAVCWCDAMDCHSHTPKQYAILGELYKTNSMAAFAVLKAYQVTTSFVVVR